MVFEPSIMEKFVKTHASDLLPDWRKAKVNWVTKRGIEKTEQNKRKKKPNSLGKTKSPK